MCVPICSKTRITPPRFYFFLKYSYKFCSFVKMYYICTAIKKVLPIHYNLREIIFKPKLYLKQNYRLWKM